MDCPKRLYDTLSSFSNQDNGGVLLFGIDETAGFQVVGVYDAQDLQKKVTEQSLRFAPYSHWPRSMITGSAPPKYRRWIWRSAPAITAVLGVSKAPMSVWEMLTSS